MPSLTDALRATNNLEGYAHVAAPARPTPVSIPELSPSMEPGRNPMLRCPVPVLWQSSPDSLRQFYMGGRVPQSRIMLPPAPVTIGTTTSTVQNNVQITGGAGSGGTGSAASGSRSGSGAQSNSAVVKTPVLPPGNKFVGTILLAKSFQILSMAVQSPCRIQLYGTAAAQASDQVRGIDVAPAAGTAQNIICDLVLDTAPYRWSFQNRIGANADSPQSTKLYVTITNLDQTSDTETLTIQYVPLES